jgi:hypothetical protein
VLFNKCLASSGLLSCKFAQRLCVVQMLASVVSWRPGWMAIQAEHVTWAWLERLGLTETAMKPAAKSTLGSSYQCDIPGIIFSSPSSQNGLQGFWFPPLCLRAGVFAGLLFRCVYVEAEGALLLSGFYVQVGPPARRSI